jgi:hypothetical protein
LKSYQTPHLMFPPLQETTALFIPEETKLEEFIIMIVVEFFFRIGR